MKNTIILRIALLIGLLGTQIVSAQDSDICRETIVAAHASVGVTLDIDSFSNKSFEEMDLTVDEFNSLTSEQQEVIYMQVKPLSVMIEETINTLNRYINRYVGTPYELFASSDLENWRKLRDTLRRCE